MAKANSRGEKQLAADPVFSALAGAILRGKYAPGTALPPEREIGALFHVSRLIARQALHRLRGMGLLRGGQGGQNIVLDPELADDPRIIALKMELAPRPTDEMDMTERQLIGGAMLLELAQHRITGAELDHLERMVQDRDDMTAPSANDDAFEVMFWNFLAGCTRNRILQTEVRWWFTMLQRQPERRQRFYHRPEFRLAAYRAVVDNLRASPETASTRFLETFRPLLKSRQTEANPAGSDPTPVVSPSDTSSD